VEREKVCTDIGVIMESKEKNHKITQLGVNINGCYLPYQQNPDQAAGFEATQ
jgi:hypothetical protein